eukprot:3898057-Ditylum_brightwellii.AAC.1
MIRIGNLHREILALQYGEEISNGLLGRLIQTVNFGLVQSMERIYERQYQSPSFISMCRICEFAMENMCQGLVFRTGDGTV